MIQFSTRPRCPDVSALAGGGISSHGYMTSIITWKGIDLKTSHRKSQYFKIWWEVTVQLYIVILCILILINVD